MELTDGTVTLRTPTEEDGPEVARVVSESLDSLSPWMPWATEEYDLSNAMQWIRGELEPGAVSMIILDPGGRFVGSAGLNHIDELNKIANLGYWLRPDATGSGYATRATRLMADHGIETMGLHRIEITMSVENEASRRVAERVGANHEAVLRGRLLLGGRHHDAHLFAIVAAAEPG